MSINNPGAAGTKREILRAAECVHCGYMVPAPGVLIPHELDPGSRRDFTRCAPGTCFPKGGKTVSLIDGRLQYTPNVRPTSR